MSPSGTNATNRHVRSHVRFRDVAQQNPSEMEHLQCRCSEAKSKVTTSIG
jgi:hypothetical protein